MERGRGGRELGGSCNGGYHNPTIRQSDNPTIQQSYNPTIRQSNNPSIQQSVNPTIQPVAVNGVAFIFWSHLSGSVYEHAFRFDISVLAATAKHHVRVHLVWTLLGIIFLHNHCIQSSAQTLPLGRSHKLSCTFCTHFVPFSSDAAWHERFIFSFF